MNKQMKLAPHDVGKLLFVCYIAYMATYFGRTTYSASIVAITSSLNCTNSDAGLVSTYFYAIYAVFQIIHGLIADRVNNKVVIALSLFVSGITNIIMPFMPTIDAMKYVWLINGIAQSAMVTHLMGVAAKMTPLNMLPRTMIILITASSVGSLLAYLFSSFFLKIASWNLLFIAGAAILIIAASVWYFVMTKLEKRRIYEEHVEALPNAQSKSTSNFRQILYIFFGGGLIISVFITVLDGIHREGMTAWFPNFVKDSFNVSEALSVLVAIALPLLSIWGSPLAHWFTKKIGHRAASVVRGTIFYTVALVLLIVLRLTAWSSLFTTCALFAILILLLTAINVSFINNTSVEMAAYGCSALLTGILNFGYCAGSSLSGYVLGAISDNFGWNAVLDFLWITAIAAIILGLMVSFFWTRFLKRITTQKTAQ